jgi:hypothetical protein
VSVFAHVQCPRGGLIIPTHSPYDRQLLREHLEQLTGPAGSVRLGLDGEEWTVTRLHGMLRGCTNCSQPLKLLHCSRTAGRTSVCFTCVLASQDDIPGEGK